jgi:hypothetical protein
MQLVAQADDLDTLNNIINNQIDLDDVMKALKDIVTSVPFNNFMA